MPWLTAGKSDKEIALRLGIAPRTASTHVENIRRKLGVSNRVGIALAAAKMNWELAPSRA